MKSSYPALEALIDAYHRRLNGRFVFRTEGAERSVVLVFRKLFFANSTEKKDRLELVLATRKLLRKEEILRIAAKAKSAGQDFMTAVQREGVLKDAALFDVMTDRSRDIINDLLTLSECEISHDPRGFAAEPILPLNSLLIPIVLNGLMNRFGADDCRRLLGSEDQVPRPVDRPYLRRELLQSPHAALAERLLERVDGRRTIVEILEGGDDDGLAAMKLLASLRMVGAFDLPNTVVETVPQPAVAAPSVEDVEVGVVTAPAELSSEEKAALSNIFEGATSLLEESENSAGSDDLVVVIDDEESGDEAGDETLALPDDHSAGEGAGEEDVVIGGDTDEELPEEPLDLNEEPPPVSPPQVQSDFNALLDIDPEEAAKLFSAGLDLFQRGRIASAIQTYQQAIDKDPSNPEYYSSLGLAYLETSADGPPDPNAAMRAFLEAVKMSPEIPKNHYYLGKIYQDRQENETAAGYYEEALRRDPDYMPAKQALEALRSPTPAKKADDNMGFLKKLFGR